MTHIELPRALEDYFAFAEIDPTRNGRRFTISLPYFDGPRLDRLQWWYHLAPDQEQRLGDAALQTLRAQATERFRRHIERWLQNTGQRLHGLEPISRLGPIAAAEPACASAPAPMTPVAESPPAEGSAELIPWPADRVANG
jgi:hypothetical protein